MSCLSIKEGDRDMFLHISQFIVLPDCSYRFSLMNMFAIEQS